MKKRDALLNELSAVFRAYQRATDALDELAAERMGVNRTDQRVLDLLEERGAMTAGGLAPRAGITSGALTGVVDRLERAGYARRVRDEHDRRRVLVEPNDKVREQAAALYGGMREKGAKAVRGYTAAELDAVIRFLRDVTAMTEL